MNSVIGIDVSKDKFDCTWLRDFETGKVKSKVLKNNPRGFQELVDWSIKNTGQSIESIHFVMEATGIYHEALAYALYKVGAKVSVVNPMQVHNYAKSLGRRTKSDKKDSAIIARFGVTHRPLLWKPESIEIRELKALIARYEAIEQDYQREANRLEKVEITQASMDVIESINLILQTQTEEKDRIRQLIDDHIDRHPQLKKDRAYLESIPGVGPIVSKFMVALIHSRDFVSAKQCAAFVGLNPIMKESGTSVRARPRLSKMGNAKLRSKLYMAAIVAIQHNPDIKQQYQRLLKNGKSKMSALGAAMRKLVQICFGVIKHQTPYQPQVK